MEAWQYAHCKWKLSSHESPPPLSLSSPAQLRVCVGDSVLLALQKAAKADALIPNMLSSSSYVMLRIVLINGSKSLFFSLFVFFCCFCYRFFWELDGCGSWGGEPSVITGVRDGLGIFFWEKDAYLRLFSWVWLVASSVW